MSMEKPYCNPEIWGGIECTINRVKNQFFDQLEFAGHYKRPEDIETIASLKIKKIRYPILWEKHQPTLQSEIDWSWSTKQIEKFKEHNIDVIAGLVHHGSGPAFTNLSDSNFPGLLADYAQKVAIQFPHINYYTPVNEPLTTARFSGLYGIWYPHKKDPASFIRMLLNEIKATVLSMEQIRKINPEAKLVQTEDLGKIYSTPKLKYQADFENERRWLTYDLLCGKLDHTHVLWNYLKHIGIKEGELTFFIENPCVPEVFGFNYYVTSERYLDERLHLYPSSTHGGNGKIRYADTEVVRVEIPEDTGVKVLLKEAWNRYQKPMAITEVHLHCTREEQLRWFNYILEETKSLVEEGVCVNAITSWALLGSYGWNKLLTQPYGDYEPGAFDLRGGNLRKTALAQHISKLNDSAIDLHPLSVEEGWWQRNSRFIYTPSIQQVRTNKSDYRDTAPVLIIGKNGTLGKAFAKICDERYITYKIVDRQECDITNKEQIQQVIDQYKPWGVINTAGYVRVDDAEKEKEKEKCFANNCEGAVNLAIACKDAGTQFISFSSDLVFDGKKSTPYIESDKTFPLNNYGKSKVQCEEELNKHFPESLLIRTSAFFGPWDEYNFIHYVKRSLSNAENIKVANDLFISPTYVPDLVNATLDLMIDKEIGIRHLANKGAITWADLAFEVADRFDLDKQFIHAVPSSQMGYIAQRPFYSVLGTEKGYILPSLENALDRYMEIKQNERRKVA